uniref:CMP-N-acetylneuraminate-beta-galactosamide-alpha-2,3-sialyltransferase 2 n=1 Tax=Ciona intestinalis TaxID=7719 RepID=F6XP52_CIOIN|nr:alpha-2,3-sialyltransferase ST3Gal I isoform X1 [Ciona intestinalis]|eukprot:XP_009857495.1 alpha-2,3-sialyltransferase ST3Gal I isoform X1 [Ciona intestinalis]
MLINFKLSRVIAMLLVVAIFLTYSWLLLWSTKTALQTNRKNKAGQDEVPVINVIKEDSYVQQKTQNLNKGKRFDLGRVNHSHPREEIQQNNKCGHQLDASQTRWFRARFNPEIEPVWTQSALEIDYLVYDWWLSLQSSEAENLDKTFEALYKEGVPRKDPFARLTHDREAGCRSCAVVGNSGNILNSNYGNEIDGHDFVIRMNKGPTYNYENDVGSKTTHRFMYPTTAASSLPQGVSLVLVPFQPLDIKWLLSALTTGEITRTYQPLVRRVTCDKSKITIISPTFIRYVHDRWTQHHGRYPSTGLLALIYALHECDEVDVYGFGANRAGNWHHYWEDLPPHVAGAFRKTGVHDSAQENEIIDQLHIHGLLRVHRSEQSS